MLEFIKTIFIFLLQENVFKSIASQGQRKSLLFACKLAEFEIFEKSKRHSPVLLLDDVFEKLDESRIKNLLKYVCQENNGQVFITDTHAKKISLPPETMVAAASVTNRRNKGSRVASVAWATAMCRANSARNPAATAGMKIVPRTNPRSAM